MRLIDVIAKWSGLSSTDLLALLNSAPIELQPKAQEWIAELTAAGSADNIANVAAFVFPELLNIAKGTIDPRDHASDAI